MTPPTASADTSERVSDRQLTTGEAAALLECSRQHVVNLCDSGRLPFTTVGRHRRLLRSDLEALRHGFDTLTREDRRSLWLAHVVAGHIASDPDSAIERAHIQLDRMRPIARGRARDWLDQWNQLLDGPLLDLLGALVDASQRGRELRQNSPFSDVLDEGRRRRALDAWRSAERQRGLEK